MDRQKLEKSGLQHNVSAFLEDEVHDYRVVNGKLHYYSRVAETDKPVEVVFEFEPTIDYEARQTRHLRSKTKPR
jgi:hypothetical protein